MSTTLEATVALPGVDFPVHPDAAEYRMLDDDELLSLAEDIAANGLRDPIVVDTDGVLLDGRNRLAACVLADVEPTFVTLPAEEDPAAFILSRNVERRQLSSGQQAMARALDLARNGQRKNGRWKRNSAIPDIRNSEVSSGWRDLMTKAGQVIDTATKYPEAAGDLPRRVKAGDLPLEAAKRLADDIVTAHASQELMLHRPIYEWLTFLEGLCDLARECKARFPKELAAPIPRDVQQRYEQSMKNIRGYLRECDQLVKEHSA